MTLLSEENGTRQVSSFFVFVFLIFKLKSTTCLSMTTDMFTSARSVRSTRAPAKPLAQTSCPRCLCGDSAL